MDQFCCSNSVGVATGVGHSLLVGLDVQTSEVDDFFPGLDGNWNFWCMLICGFSFLSGMSIALIKFKLHPGGEYCPMSWQAVLWCSCYSSVDAFDSMAS